MEKSSNPEVEIRLATPDDIPAIYNLVLLLAEYEKEKDSVTATIQDYQRDFEQGHFQALVALVDGKHIGMAFYYRSYSTWKGRMIYLDDLIVVEAWRRNGIGQMLFDAFLTEAKKWNTALVKWQVLDWNEPALKFYQKNKAMIETNWWNVKIIF